jgi:dextranase
MKKCRCAVMAILVLILFRIAVAQTPGTLKITDVYTDKARYAPQEPVTVLVSLSASAHSAPPAATLDVSFWHLAEQVGHETKTLNIGDSQVEEIPIVWMPPAQDFSGYFVDVRLDGPDGKELDRSQTAVDVSSEWNRFPRYGYLAHYSSAEVTQPAEWIAELNKYHIDGLEYYDFQHRHEDPLAGSVQHPADRWSDIAGREIDRSVLEDFLAAARGYNMMSMAYDSSYSAYADAFTDGSGVKLPWATWETPHAPRTLQTVFSLNLPAEGGWATPRLIYMNQNSLDWQNYLFDQMANLFRAYPFDGWHIDTFGTQGAYAYDGAYVSFIDGFRPFINHARDALHKRIVLNTVNTWGQTQTAHSAADFVYSELWEDHETYASIAASAEEVHMVNPEAGLVFAAYLHRREGEHAPPPPRKDFNLPSVLLADATIFASGASHIELGDGSRMLSGEYFPKDKTFAVTPELQFALRPYYDFLTAYENVLRYEITPAPVRAVLHDHPSDPDGVPNSVWTLARQKDGVTVLHLINLLGSDDPHWRDMNGDRPDAPLLTEVKARIYADQVIGAVHWATPDADGGRLHPLPFTAGSEKGQRYVDITLPSLKYWDMILLQSNSTGNGGI